MKYNFLYNKNRTNNEQRKIFKKCIKYYDLELKNKNIIDYINYLYLYKICFN